MSSHSVSRHLRLDVESYDEEIRRFLPEYETMIARAADAACAARPRHVIDLGAGTGALAQAVLERSEDCRITLIDVDPEMLDRARARLAPHAQRTQFLERSFHGPLPECDAIVASLALHHVPTLEEKRVLYRAVRAALSADGVFANADVTIPSDPAARQADYEVWAAHLVASGIPEGRAWQHFEEWSDEDVYFSLEEELDALRSAGLDAECLWRTTPSTVMKAVRT